MFYPLLLLVCQIFFVNPNCGALSAKSQSSGKSLGRQNGKEVYEYDGHRYTFYLEPKTWEQAAQICERDNSYLAILENIMEVDFLSRAMDGRLCSYTAFQNVWIGGRFYPSAGNRWIWPMTGYEIIGRPGDDGSYPPWKLSRNMNNHCLNMNQELNHKPSFVDLDCSRKRRFVCENGCTQLYDTDRGYWEPDGCLLDPGHLGDICSMICQPGYELDGDKTVNCTSLGWNSTVGVNRIPDCKQATEIADDILEVLKSQVALNAKQIAFVVDESVNMSDEMFTNAKKFITAIIRAYPLTKTRTAGFITFASSANIREPTTTADTCRFLNTVDDTTQSKNGLGSLSEALSTTRKNINEHINHPRAIIILITATSNDDKTKQIVETMKKNNNKIMVLGVGEHFIRRELISIASNINRQPLFFSIKYKDNFLKISEHITKRLGEAFVDPCKRAECTGFMETNLGHWRPDLCLKKVYENKTCELVCEPETMLTGSSILTCSKKGWIHPNGTLIDAPKCEEIPPEEKMKQYINTISLQNNASFLYIVEESFREFEEFIHFIVGMTYTFPLSQARRAGLITFSSDANVRAPLLATDTCTFINQNRRLVRSTNTASSNLLSAIKLANLEMQRNNPNNKTVIVILSDTNTTEASKKIIQEIQTRGGIVTCVSPSRTNLGESATKNKTENYLNFNSHKDFNLAVKYLNSTVSIETSAECSIKCKKVENSTRGDWKPVTCTQNNSEEGDKCYLMCKEQYVLVGSNPLICGPNGWTGTAGDFIIPQCKAPEEIAENLLQKINGSIGYGISSNLLFVLDESGSIGKQNFMTEKDFIISVIEAFPLSENRMAGILTFASTTELHLPVNTKDSCLFIKNIQRIGYNGGGTNVNGALTAGRAELKRRGVHKQSLIFLITDGISQTDPEYTALILKNEGKIIFVIGVADYDQEQLEPLASIGPDGTPNFFGVKSFHVFRVIAHYLNSRYADISFTLIISL